MKHNILITGKPGSGKSTLAGYLLQGFDKPWAGFQSIKTGKCPAGPLFSLKAMPGGESAPISREENGLIRPVEATFETLGADALAKAISGPEEILLLDEIGRFEKNCPAFLAQIDAVMDSEKTVIAVLKKEPLPHIERLLCREDAFVIDLDETSPYEARVLLDSLLWPERSLHWGLTLRLYGTQKAFGPGPMQLLMGVERTGSLHKAAAEMGMAYSKAWALLNRLEAAWGFALLERRSGGAKGGSSTLTPEGAELLRRYQAMLREVEQAAALSFEKNFSEFARSIHPSFDKSLFS